MLSKDKLVVREVNLNHENHRSDETTFAHYPENQRLNNKQKKKANDMIRVGVKMTKLKSYFMEQGTTVPLKTLHNMKTKQQNLNKCLDESNELKQLLQELQKIPNATIRVYTNENDELIGKFVEPNKTID